MSCVYQENVSFNPAHTHKQPMGLCNDTLSVQTHSLSAGYGIIFAREIY